MIRFLKRQIKRVLEIFLVPVFLIIAFVARFCKKEIDIGLGPEPIINNIYHKKALTFYGYSVETFVVKSNFISSEYDYNASQKIKTVILALLWLSMRSFFRYKAIYIYFNGGPLSFLTEGNFNFLRWLEPYLYKIANVKIVVMPYGGDVYNLFHCPNLHFKEAMISDCSKLYYRRRMVAANVERWTEHADHVISGCDWVDYMYHWDTLMVAHFSIDLKKFEEYHVKQNLKGPFRILHAPNHRTIKGTDHLIEAVQALKHEGLDIELVLLEKRPNEQILEAIASCDLVADQFVIGWYAMFALEAMAMGKPVLCYLRKDLIDLYTSQKLFSIEECPIINTPFNQIKEQIKFCYEHREQIRQKGLLGPEYIKKTHSLQSVGGVFDTINKKIGISHG